MADTYGDAGNRWWVGWNHAQGDFASFPSLSGPSGYESFPSGSAADDAAIVAAGTGGTVSLHNITWTILGGPYATQAAADAAIPAIQAAAPAPGAGQQVTGVNFGSVQDALTAFYRTVTDGKLWRSLGWLLLGVVLLFTGIGLLIGPAAARRSPMGVAADFARKAYG
jgi:uncharacterized membrane protein YccF (DUF307 family)